MADAEILKKKLMNEIVLVKKRIQELHEDDPFSDPDHLVNNAAVDTDVREQEAHMRIEAEIETLNERLVNIESAIERIEKGRYGYCKRCNKDIPEKRLELIPETKYCVDCESAVKQ